MIRGIFPYFFFKNLKKFILYYIFSVTIYPPYSHRTPITTLLSVSVSSFSSLLDVSTL